MRKRLKHHGTRTRSHRSDDAPDRDIWKAYVRRNHNLENGLPHRDLEPLLDGEVLDVGPISHLNAGMMANDLGLLRGLARLYDHCTYFEIGRRRSESLGNMASVAEECYALNRPVEETRRKGIRHKYMFMMGSITRAMDNTVLLSGDSRTFDFRALDKKFDIVFINSGQRYERVLHDTRKAFEYLVHAESTVVWHDYSYFPEEIRYEVLAGILDGTGPLDREQLFFVSKTKCAILLRDKIYDLG